MPLAKKSANQLIEAVEIEDDDDRGIETESDVGKVPLNILKDAVVFSTDWTTETLIGQLVKGNIDLDPAFQRRDAWNARRKSKFIESLILGLPVPQIVLAEKKSAKGSFLIIDGKQRLLSLQKFVRGGAPDEEPFSLVDLELRHDLNGTTYQDLRKRKADLNSFENQTIRTVVIRHWQKEEILYHIFHRLNSETLPLSPQELRQALHPGPFLRFSDEHSQSSPGLQKILRIRKPDFRMRDIELLVRFFSFKNFADDYKGDLKKFLDDACESLNKKWISEEELIRKQAAEFELAVLSCYEIFEEHPFNKWNSNAETEGYENRFNRAIFDVMIYFFSDKKIRNVLTKRMQSKIRSEFKNLCLKDEGFIKSIESTTKSKTATSTRFNKWAAVLSNVTKQKINAPKIH